jgi:putative DNA primase/helicase
MDARAITLALGGHWHGRHGLCRCPSHADRNPSLMVKDDARKSDGIDVHCFAGCPWEDVKDELGKHGLLESFSPVSTPRALTPISTSTEEADQEKLRRAVNIWRTSVPLAGTLGERYLTEIRGVDLSKISDLSHALRFHHDLKAVIACMSYPATGIGCGVHRTFLNEDGTKRDRMMLGRAGVVRLTPDEDVLEGLGICEGIEDGLAILASGWTPVWAATSAGAIASFPVLPGIEALTIFADKDKAGIAAANTCRQRWIAAGREVFVP